MRTNVNLNEKFEFEGKIVRNGRAIFCRWSERHDLYYVNEKVFFIDHLSKLI